MAGYELEELARDEIIEMIVREVGQLAVRDFLSRLKGLCKKGTVPRFIWKSLSSSLHGHRDDLLVTLQEYPGLLALTRGDTPPVVMETEHGIVVVNGDAIPYLGLLRQSADHGHLVSFLTAFGELLFEPEYSSSLPSILATVCDQLPTDFQELYGLKLRELRIRIDDVLEEFQALQFKIEMYRPKVAGLLREYILVANQAFDVLVDGLGRLDQISAETKISICRCSSALINRTGMLSYYLTVYNPQETYYAENLTYRLMDTFQTYYYPTVGLQGREALCLKGELPVQPL